MSAVITNVAANKTTLPGNQRRGNSQSPAIKSSVAQLGKADPQTIARANWERYNYVKMRGHLEWAVWVKRLEQMYIGGGLQWLPEDKAYMEGEVGRKCIEVNEIADAVNNAIGYQVNNRVDIAFRPRNQGASEEIATTLSKVAMQVADNCRYQWHETQVFSDGLIQQRGYFETRMRFDDNMRGEIGLWTLDPLDVIPDPDAKSYDPDDWGDVTVTRWLTYDEVEAMYGSAARREVENRGPLFNERDFGFDLNEVERNKFGTDNWNFDRQYDAYYEEAGIPRVRIIDRQHWQMTNTRVVVFPTGDIRSAANATPEQLSYWKANNCIILLRPFRRVRWTVSCTDSVLLHDDWSPYDHFTIVPYFPFFRRGYTKGYVDDMVGPQELLNKSLSQYLHIVNTQANSGWLVAQNSLTNMSTDDLRDYGARTGVVLEYREGATKPEKIQPAQIPSGINNLIQIGSDKIRRVSGQNDGMRGLSGANQSGVAIQSNQFAAQMSLAMPLDNLARTRHLLASRWLEYIQRFMDEPQIWRISKTLPNGQKTTEELQTNQQQDDGSILNDLTVGEYDVVITEQPTQITYENSQFNQAIAMRKEGIKIPDTVVVRYSNLADKTDIIDQMQQQAGSEDPLTEAKVASEQAKTALAQAQAVAKNVEAMFSAIRTSQVISLQPAVSPIADQIVRSAGFKDADPAPEFPTPAQAEVAGASGQVTPPPNNTHPATPDNAQRGMDTGIEAGPTT